MKRRRYFTKLICGEKRLAPIEEPLLSFVELMSARVFAGLMSNMIQAISSSTKIERVRLWLEGKTALYGYILMENRSNRCSSRLREILEVNRERATGSCSW